MNEALDELKTKVQDMTQDELEGEKMEHQETLSKLNDLTHDLKAVSDKFEEYKAKNDAKWEALEAKTAGNTSALTTNSEDTSEFQTEPKEPSDMTTQAQDPTDHLRLKIAELEAALDSKTRQITKMEQEHQENVQNLVEQLDNVYSTLAPQPEALGSDDIKDARVEALEDRIKELQMILQANLDDFERAQADCEKAQAEAAELRAQLRESTVEVDSKTLLIWEMEREQKKMTEKIDELICTYHLGPRAEPMAESKPESESEPKLKPGDAKDSKIEALEDGVKELQMTASSSEPKESSDLSTQDSLGSGAKAQNHSDLDSAPSSEQNDPSDLLRLKIAELEAELHSKTRQITEMEQEHQENVQNLVEQLDNVYSTLAPQPEALGSQDIKDARVEILEDRIKELEVMLQVNMDDFERAQAEAHEANKELKQDNSELRSANVALRKDLCSKSRLISEMEREQKEMSERLDDLIYTAHLVPKAESEPQYVKDSQIKALEDRVKELQMIIQANSDSSESPQKQDLVVENTTLRLNLKNSESDTAALRAHVTKINEEKEELKARVITESGAIMQEVVRRLRAESETKSEALNQKEAEIKFLEARNQQFLREKPHKVRELECKLKELTEQNYELKHTNAVLKLRIENCEVKNSAENNSDSNTDRK